MKKMVLLNPGPVMVSDAVRKCLMQPDMCHREPEFSEILSRVRQKLLFVFGGTKEYCTMVLTGSGTASLDATLSSVVKRDKKILVIVNGGFGERLEQIATTYNMQKEVLRYNWGEPPQIEQVAKLLEEDKGIDVVAMCHQETSTGMINPVRKVGELCKKYQRTLVVDAISSLGGEKLSVTEDNIDFCISSANKSIASFPGLSFVCAKRDKLDSTKDNRRTFYLDLYTHFYNEEILNGPPFTPAVQIFFALETALDELIAEGIDNRINKYKTLAETIRNGLAKLGLELFLPPQHRSNTVTSVLLPQGISFEALHNELKAKGFIIYAGKGPLSEKTFQVANMGALTTEDIYKFLAAFEASLMTFGFGFQ